MTLENREAARIVYRPDGRTAGSMGREIGDLAGLGRGVRYVVVSSADDGLGRAGEQINTSEFGCRIHKNVGNILLSRGGEARGGGGGRPRGQHI